MQEDFLEEGASKLSLVAAGHSDGEGDIGKGTTEAKGWQWEAH